MRGVIPIRSKLPRVNQEWVIGKDRASTYLEDQGTQNPEILLILEGSVLLGYHYAQPGKAFDIQRLLESTMRKPMEGEPRCPSSYRVAEPELEQVLREAFPDAGVTQASTPEVDLAMEKFRKEFNYNEEVGYTQDGIIPEPVLAEMFKAAKLVYQTAPWEAIKRDNLLEVDVESAGIEGGVLFVIGDTGQNCSIIYFPSPADHNTFIEFVNNPEQGPPPLAPTEKNRMIHLALRFEKATDISSAKRKEVVKNQWPVINLNSYPMLMPLYNDFMFTDPTVEDITLMTALLTSLSEFYTSYHSIFNSTRPVRRRKTYTINGLNVKLTYPYGSYRFF